MFKKIGKIFIFSILIISLVGCGKKLEEKEPETNELSQQNEQETKEESKQITYLDMYEEYLKNNFYGDEKINANKFSGGFFKANEDDKNPFLIVKYQLDNKEFYIKVLHISGDEVIASDDYKSTGINYLYNLEKSKVEYFIKDISYGTYYKSILDIIDGKAEKIELREDDFNQEYVYIDEPIELYSVNEISLTDDLKKLDETYKNYDMSKVNKKVEEIESKRLKADDNGIYNGQYRIEYGTYLYGNYKLTLNKDNSINQEYLPFNSHWDGSYYLQYDRIKTNISGVSNLEFIIIDNNKIQRVSDKTIWNLAK